MLCGIGTTADDIFDALCVLSEQSEVKDHGQGGHTSWRDAQQ